MLVNNPDWTKLSKVAANVFLLYPISVVSAAVYVLDAEVRKNVAKSALVPMPKSDLIRSAKRAGILQSGALDFPLSLSGKGDVLTNVGHFASEIEFKVSANRENEI